MAVVEAVALRIEACGGFALFVDYGKDAPYDSSLNAIRNHRSVHPLQVRAPQCMRTPVALYPPSTYPEQLIATCFESDNE